METVHGGGKKSTRPGDKGTVHRGPETALSCNMHGHHNRGCVPEDVKGDELKSWLVSEEATYDKWTNGLTAIDVSDAHAQDIIQNIRASFLRKRHSPEKLEHLCRNHA